MNKKPTPKNSKLTAALTTGMAAALAPQHTEADIVTVGGDGGTGSVTLSSLGNSTNLGGILLDSISYNFTSSYNAFYLYRSATSLNFRYAVRSNQSFTGNDVPLGSTSYVRTWTFSSDYASDYEYEGAAFNSDDNWVPGLFAVDGVNSGDPIWGWLQVELGSGPNNFDPTIISFTYDDAATDASPFEKPIGGFAVPEPAESAFGLGLLALGAAGVRRYLSRKKQTISAQASDS